MNLTEIPRMHLNWLNMLVLNGNIVTDTFFLLSGILLAYTELTKKQKDPNWNFNAISIYVHRYLRLTPAYAMMIGFYATLFYKFGNGPHWDNWVGSNRDFCRDNWWTNLLYVNNYVNLPTMCMSQSWYLATDMQLVWLSPILLYPMLKFTQGFIFWLVFALALFLSVLLPFLITFFLRLTGTMLYYKEQSLVAEVYQQIYTRVYARFGPYIIGLALGFILYKTRSRSVRIPTLYVISGWIVAAVAGFFAVFGPRSMYFDEYPYGRMEASFYAGFHRQVFALAISWIVFCSVHGYGGLVGQFLSWRGWVPLAKLTYSAYLCHYLFLLSDSGAVRTTTVLTTMGIVRTFFANLCLTMLLSALWSLCFEMPFMTLDRILISQRKGQSRLTVKPNQGKMFGSIDSGKEIYRSTEETSSSVSQSYNDEIHGKCSTDSVYNSAGNISFHQEINENVCTDRNTQWKSSEQEKPYSVYVISPTEGNDTSIWSKMSVQKSCNYDVNLQDDFDEAVDESSRIKLKKELDSRYGSVVKEDSVRKNENSEEEKLSVGASKGSTS